MARLRPRETFFSSDRKILQRQEEARKNALAELRQLHAKRVETGSPENHVLTVDDIDAAARAGKCLSFGAINARFHREGIAEILRKAGLPYESAKPAETNFTKAGIEEWVKNFVNENGKKPNVGDVALAKRQSQIPQTPEIITTLCKESLQAIIRRYWARHELAKLDKLSRS